jgi:hypothetical protein
MVVRSVNKKLERVKKEVIVVQLRYLPKRNSEVSAFQSRLEPEPANTGQKQHCFMQTCWDYIHLLIKGLISAAHTICQTVTLVGNDELEEMW